MNTDTSASSHVVQDHPSSPAIYIRHGWRLVPIRQGTKGPRTAGWNRKENALTDPTRLPSGFGFGLAHAYSSTMALDVDHWERADQELRKHGIDLQALYDAPDAVTIESGKPGHGKLLYRMPFGVAYPSKKLVDTDDQGLRYNYLDFRCATASGLTVQDVLPPSMHPETKQPYRWGGKGKWTDLPIIPEPLFDFWRSLVTKDQQRNLDDGAGGVPASWDEINHALEHISPDVSRDEWVSVGMALHWAATQAGELDTGFHVWNEWSATSDTKYMGQGDLVTQWRSFKADNGVTLGTLFHIAKSYGWTRPPIDPATLFSDVPLANPTADDPVEEIDDHPFDIFAGLQPPPPDINIDLFPKVLADRAIEVADSMGADPLVPLFAGMAVVSGAMDARTRLQLNPTFSVPPVLWLVTVGAPADMKTPASRPMGAVLQEIEMEDREPYKKRMLEWQGKEAAYAAAHKAFLDYHSSPESQLDNDATPEVPDLENPPVPAKITVSDITSQKLVRHASERPRGLLCWLDEMHSWARSLTDSRSGENRSCWVQAYESAPYEMDRVGAGSIWCSNFAVTVYGNIQPDIFRQHIERLSDDGLVQRFVPSILRARYSDRKGKPIPDCFSTKPVWDQVVRTAHGMNRTLYTLSPEAHEEFDKFLDWWGELKREERLLMSDKIYQGAIGKLSGTTGRLALIWHAIEAPYNPLVSGDLMRRVVEFVKSYVVPALRYTYDEIGTQQSVEAWFYGYILQHSGVTDTVMLRELKHAARRRLEKFNAFERDRVVLDIMGMAEKANWVKLVDSDQKRNSYTWAINPQLAKTYKAQRDLVIRIKQKRVEEFTKKGGKDPRKAPIIPGYDPKELGIED